MYDIYDITKLTYFEYRIPTGNQNKFDTAEECESKCGNVQDLCGLPAVRGRCQENVTRYYYEARSDQCLTFEYSGCRGNKNNFYSEQDCASQCQRQRQPEQPAPTPPQTENVILICDFQLYFFFC